MARHASHVSARVVQDRTIAEAVRLANLNVRNDTSMVVYSATVAPWAGITGTPTTLAGYGITSPLAIAEGGTALSALGTTVQYLRVNVAATALEYHTLVAADITDLATAATGITKVGTIDTGIWNGTAITDTYIASATTWNAKEPGLGNPASDGYILSSTALGVRSWVAPYALPTILATLAALSNAAGWLHNDGAGVLVWSTPTKSDVGLSNVENTALSTWAGSSCLVTLGPAPTAGGRRIASRVFAFFMG